MELYRALADGRLNDEEAAALLWAAAPAALGGVLLRCRPGPAREHWRARAREAWQAAGGTAAAWWRLPAGVGEDRLLGGLDVTLTLAEGRPVQQPGLLEQAAGSVLEVPMAERLSPTLAAHLARALEGEPAGRPALLVFDESAPEPAAGAAGGGAEGGAEGGVEQVPGALTDRLALWLDLDRAALARRLGTPASAAPDESPWPQALARLANARSEWPAITLPTTALAEWVALGAACGVPSLRALQAGLAVARVGAALAGRREAAADDFALALRLVLLPRATRLPAGAAAGESDADDVAPDDSQAESAEDESPVAENERPTDEAPPPPPAPPPPAPPPPLPPPAAAAGEAEPDSAPRDDGPPPDIDPAWAERLVAAALARLPPGLLASLQARLALAAPARGAAGRQGARLRQGRRGAPMGARPGDPRRGERLALVESLRAAAPWQPLRHQLRGNAAIGPTRPILLASDLHVRRHRPKGATVALFVVDASGSAAAQRMAEAKGAVERLLADCYARRDQVALLAFGGRLATQADAISNAMAAAPPARRAANPGVQMLLPPTRSLVRAKRCLADLPGGGGTPLAAALAEAARQGERIRRAGALPLIVLLTDGRANLGHHGEPLARAEAAALAQAAARECAVLALPALLIDISPRPSPAAQALAEALRGRYLPLPAAAPGTALADAVRAARRPAAAARPAENR